MALDTAAFERFYTDHFDAVYRFIFFRVGTNKEVAEDLVSEIFMKALKAFETYDPKISHKAWITTIARNHLINYWRDSKSILPLPEATEEDGGGGEAFWLKSALKEHARREDQRETYELLARLEPQEQEIVTFHYLFGYSYKEIAEEKGMSETAVKVAAHRAIKKMRTFL